MNGIAPQRLPGVIGHELRNPLAAAMTGAMLAREMVDDGDPRGPVLDGVLRDLDRTAKLLDGWLRIAGPTGASLVPTAVPELLRSLCARHRVDLVGACADVEIAADRLLLERAFENMFENARLAGANKLRVAVQTLDDEITVHVEDDGCGVPRDQVDRIFGAGWSGRGSTGIGLYAVSTTVAAHGGTIRCVPLPRGTRFTMTLPLLQRPVANASSA